ncbi:hypothetical protein HHI36_007778 [Cryptolaemus montrouzieri]|uniref:Uncharacterized protein n=1 Tax=Cryptolaemus montrouzieri TaxID=559131 RepID=A0ABD2MQI9_9CUCU
MVVRKSRRTNTTEKIAYHSTKTQEDRKNYQKERRDTADAFERSQNEYWDKICEEMNNGMGNTRANKPWKIIKGLRTNNSDTDNDWKYRIDPRDSEYFIYGGGRGCGVYEKRQIFWARQLEHRTRQGSTRCSHRIDCGTLQ